MGIKDLNSFLKENAPASIRNTTLLDSFKTIKTLTVASLLSRMRNHSYIGTKNYTKGSDSKINPWKGEEN